MKRRESGERLSFLVTCSAPVNIAVVKYWGKRDEEKILPVNSSLSGTLHQDDLKSTTTIMADERFDKDRIWLNGVEEDINGVRLQQCLREIRNRIEDRKDKNGNIISRDEIVGLKIHIVSENNFPTASGLASSASGFACLVNYLTSRRSILENYLLLLVWVLVVPVEVFMVVL
jgi:diphosphomevalonate decarboxylase